MDIVDRLREHHKSLWGHGECTESIMTDAAFEIGRLRAALVEIDRVAASHRGGIGVAQSLARAALKAPRRDGE